MGEEVACATAACHTIDIHAHTGPAESEAGSPPSGEGGGPERGSAPGGADQRGSTALSRHDQNAITALSRHDQNAITALSRRDHDGAITLSLRCQDGARVSRIRGINIGAQDGRDGGPRRSCEGPRFSAQPRSPRPVHGEPVEPRDTPPLATAHSTVQSRNRKGRQ